MKTSGGGYHSVSIVVHNIVHVRALSLSARPLPYVCREGRRSERQLLVGEGVRHRDLLGVQSRFSFLMFDSICVLMPFLSTTLI